MECNFFYPQNDKRSLLCYVLAAASIYGIWGCGPAGPAPTFVGADFSDAGAVGRHISQSGGEKQHEGLRNPN
jgi:hypothetical protein